MRTFHQTCQAVALAVVFAGYLVGWRNELVGGLLSVFGTIAFVAICAVTFGAPPAISSAWFAIPGVLFLVAWYYGRRHGQLIL
jgi:hypothetical protein